MQAGDIENRFCAHLINDNGARRTIRLRQEYMRVAMMVDALAPDSREKSLALSELEASMMWTNKAIACNEEMLPPLDVFERRFGEKLLPGV